mmetsp:Transcript_28373/g.86763  ORF Transcript_28373/g.86763 Transcript_28373/m.86763 type:complete len:110 (-) Transcript_28373:222-551(-)
MNSPLRSTITLSRAFTTEKRGWCSEAMTRMPCFSQRFLSTSTTRRVLTASSALVGSSRSRMAGRVTSSAPMPTRRSWPPDSFFLECSRSHEKWAHAASPSRSSTEMTML